MKRAEELKTKKLLPRIYDISTPEPNFTRSTSPESISHAKGKHIIDSISTYPFFLELIEQSMVR